MKRGITGVISFYYFSGTGNTRRLTERSARAFERRGYQVHCYPMEGALIPDLSGDTTLGLAFPVAVQSTFPLVWSCVEALPEGRGQPVFLFNTLQAFSGGIIGPMKKLLEGKGYRCIGAREFRMSSSLNSKPEKLEAGRVKNRKAEEAMEGYVEELISGRSRWGRIPVLSDLMRRTSASPKIWRSMSRKIGVSSDCIRCGACVKACPVSAMRLEESGMEIDRELCISCMRCFSVCPVQALRLDGKKLFLS